MRLSPAQADNQSGMRLIDSAIELADSYPVWFCDVWGVVHDGLRRHPSAVAALQKFRARGGCVMLLTNAPRPAAFVEQRLAALGIEATAYDAVITSGDVTHALLASASAKRLFYIGPPHDLPSLDSLHADLVAEENADSILCTGLIDDESETAQDYRAWFSELVKRQLPFYCANPDRVVQRGPRLVPCAGSLADLYAELGGEVIIAGKPFAPIYERAFEAAGEVIGSRPPANSVLAIGDGLQTDMLGAARQKLDALFVLDGIHAEELGFSADTIGEKELTALERLLAEHVRHLNCIGVMQMLK